MQIISRVYTGRQLLISAADYWAENSPNTSFNDWFKYTRPLMANENYYVDDKFTSIRLMGMTANSDVPAVMYDGSDEMKAKYHLEPMASDGYGESITQLLPKNKNFSGNMGHWMIVPGDWIILDEDKFMVGKRPAQFFRAKDFLQITK